MQQQKKKNSNLTTIIFICFIAIGLYLSFQDDSEDSRSQSGSSNNGTNESSNNESYDYTGEYTEGLAPVKVNGLWGYIDTNENIAIEPQFDYAWNFFGGIAAVTIGRDYGLIDTSGSFIERTAIDLPELALGGYTGPITADTDMDIISDITDNVIQQTVGTPVSLGLDYAQSLEDFSSKEYKKLVDSRDEAYDLYIKALDERNEAAQKALIEAEWAGIRLNGY